MKHDIQRGWHGGVYYYCERCGVESPYENIGGDCMEFSSLSDDELKSLTAEWYAKHRQALDYYTQLRAERTRRLVDKSDQLYFTEYGAVPKNQEGT